MQKVLVSGKNKAPLMPCHPTRARQLLKMGKAAVYKRFPFTIVLKNRAEGHIQAMELKLDPGSKTTGIALAQIASRAKRPCGSQSLITAARRSETAFCLAGRFEGQGALERPDTANLDFQTGQGPKADLHRLFSPGWIMFLPGQTVC